MSEQRKRYFLQLVPADDFPHPERRLAAVIKSLGRHHGFRCIACGEIPQDTQVEPAEHSGPEEGD